MNAFSNVIINHHLITCFVFTDMLRTVLYLSFGERKTDTMQENSYKVLKPGFSWINFALCMDSFSFCAFVQLVRCCCLAKGKPEIQKIGHFWCSIWKKYCAEASRSLEYP